MFMALMRDLRIVIALHELHFNRTRHLAFGLPDFRHYASL